MKKFNKHPWEAKDMFGNWVLVDADNNIINIRENEAVAKCMAASPEMLDALENLIIGIGMGWDLEGLIEVSEKALAKAKDFNAADYVEFIPRDNDGL